LVQQQWLLPVLLFAAATAVFVLWWWFMLEPVLGALGSMKDRNCYVRQYFLCSGGFHC
jgi:hypothetical protein